MVELKKAPLFLRQAVPIFSYCYFVQKKKLDRAIFMSIIKQR
jgi:hypothetical protein